MRNLFVALISIVVAVLCLLPVIAEAAVVVVKATNASSVTGSVTVPETQGQVRLAYLPGQCHWVRKCVLWRHGHCVKRKLMKRCPYPPFWFTR